MVRFDPQSRKDLQKVESADELAYEYVPARTFAIVLFIFIFLVFIVLTGVAYEKMLYKEPKEFLLLLKYQGFLLAGSFMLSFLIAVYQLLFNDENSTISDVLLHGSIFYAVFGVLFFMVWSLSETSK